MISRIRVKLPVSVAVLTLMAAGYVHAQEAVGGPYTADSNTMLLLHFDGDYTNESDSSADGVAHGAIAFVTTSAYAALGQSLYLDNDAEGDSSYVTVADTSSLDLIGDWTIEGWVNVITFGESSEDHRWVPRLIIKTGDEVFWRPNYWVEFWGDNRFYSFGYHDIIAPAWPQVNTQYNFVEVGVWYHLTFIRDATNHVLINMIHDDQKEMIFFGAAAEDPSYTPVITEQPAHIGWAGSLGMAAPSNDSWLDGFVDEIRVSNVVRDFAMPPAIVSVTEEDTLDPETAISISADVMKVGASGTVATVELKYSIDDGTTWTTAAMALGTGNTYSSEIPGQSNGTVVDYYILATDDGGLQSTAPGGALTDSIYYSFEVFGLGTEPVSQGLPTRFELSQNYPNPFNPTTQIEFTMLRRQHVTLAVFDLVGREVITLVDREVEAGKYTVGWNGRNELDQPVAGGVYLYRVNTGEVTLVRKMVLLK